MKTNDILRVYFGTQAKDEWRGIYMTLFDTETGTLGIPAPVTDSIRPGFIQIHPNGEHLYATEASGSCTETFHGAVSAYRIQKNGMLTDLNTQSSGGLGPCHLSLNPSGTELLVANYRGGSCAILPILGNGTLGAPFSIQKHSGSGPNKARQEAAHTHSFTCDPAGRFALAADLGLDQILVYRLTDDKLVPTDPPFVAVAPGSGPRHLVFSPNGRFVYVGMELSGTVAVFEYAEGILTERQTLSTLPADFDGENLVSEVRITPDGRFLYIGNRGHESLAIFAVDSESGLLCPLGHEPTRGKHPRHFNINPSGSFLIVANAHTNNVVVFKIDQKTGQLTFTGSEILVPVATCVQFLPIIKN